MNKTEHRQQQEGEVSSKREAPISRKEPLRSKESTMRRDKRQNKHDSRYTRHVEFVISTSKPSAAMLERLRVRINVEAEQLKQRYETRELSID